MRATFGDFVGGCAKFGILHGGNLHLAGIYRLEQAPNGRHFTLPLGLPYQLLLTAEPSGMKLILS